jgi:glycosyltransferase involved in cell wall biosynthesis
VKFCMVTSFFGSHSLGGDAVYIDRLSRALLRRGHQVHVAFSSSAYKILPDRLPLRSYQTPPGLVLHDLGGGIGGYANALWAHQTGGSLCFANRLESLLDNHQFDVIHLHNISLLGGRGLSASLRRRAALKLTTMHDYWWFCPQSLLGKNGARVCEEPACFTCSLLARRPPQLWRRKLWFNQTAEAVDAVLFPSRSALEIYQAKGFEHPRQYVLPGMLDGEGTSGDEPPAPSPAPYFAAAGRLVLQKGFQTLIPLMRHLPGVQLRIAGAGPAERHLHRLAHGLPNVQFLGLFDHGQIRSLFLGARAVMMPSLFPETFGLVMAEALSLGAPVIARDLGSLSELARACSGGLLYENDEQLLGHMRALACDEALRERLGREARASVPRVWFEEEHTRAYLDILSELRLAQGGRELP